MKRCGALVILAVLARPVFAPAQAPAPFRAVDAFPRLRFERPVDLQNAGDARLFVVEQAGVVKVFAGDSTVATATVFLDIRDRVDAEGPGMGLAGLAFPPDFHRDGHFFVYYTAGTDSLVGRLSRFSVREASPDLGDDTSERVVLEVEQHVRRGGGGSLAFGPDGFLYLGLGDGGVPGNAQNLSTLAGAVIRIDTAELPYGIPTDNPFAGNTGGRREEIFAWGLHDPWRLSFDGGTGWLWTGDRGQSAWEEVNVIERGRNYGWDCREGYQPHAPATGRSPRCGPAEDYAPPSWAFAREDGESITGGRVYRGSRLGELVGYYVYADYATGRISALLYDRKRLQTRPVAETGLHISAFGESSAGELFFCDHDAGGAETKIYRLAPAEK